MVSDFENRNDGQKTITELVENMAGYLEGSSWAAYSTKYMKAKILEHFGNRAIITVLRSKECVVTLRETASAIFYAFHKQKPQTPEEEKHSVVITAAKLIQSDVKSVFSSNDNYPSRDDMASVFIPQTLDKLLRSTFAGKDIDVKTASIGQVIMQAVRPRAILAPLQIGLAVQMHHHFASRFLIETLHQDGFSASYGKVQKYERCSAVTHKTDIPGLTGEESVQFVADNFDHNVATLDGTGTFHGMGIIAVITPKVQTPTTPIPRVHVTSEEIAEVGRISIEYFKIPTTISPLTYLPLLSVLQDEPTAPLDVLWKSSLLLQSPRPAWSIMMQMLHCGPRPCQSSIVFLPMNDLNPSDLSCIYSTLTFICS